MDHLERERSVTHNMASTQQNKNLFMKFFSLEDRRLISFLNGSGLGCKRFKNYADVAAKRSQQETVIHWDSKK